MDKEKIIKVLEAEQALIATSVVHYKKRRCGHPGRCAIGALLFAAGVTDKQLWEIEEVTQRCSDTEAIWGLFPEYGDLLYLTYGLDECQAAQIMSENDSPGKECQLGSGPEWRQDRKRVECVVTYVREM